MNKHSTARAPFCTGKGQSDTHAITLSDGRKNTHPSAGKPYDIIRFEAIVSMVENPPSVPKDQAQWIIPSAYTGHDARTHDIQRQRGLFRLLPLDVDEGNLPLQDVMDAVQAVAGPCAYVAYSTRGAEPDLLKWRVLIPLAQPIEGVDYAAFVEAFNDLLIEQTGGKLIPDRKLQGAGQLIYLPNKGDHYEYHISLDALLLDPAGPNDITRQREKTARARSVAEKAAKAQSERRAAERRAKGSDETSPVDHFNDAHSIADLLEKYGYTRNGQSNDYRSPMQTSRSYATQARDGHWISLSGSDDNAGIGAADKNGNRYGDAFDLFVYFEHGGNFEEGVKAYAEEAQLQGGGDAFSPDLHKVFGRRRGGSDSHQEGAGEAQDGAEQRDDPGDGPQEQEGPIPLQREIKAAQPFPVDGLGPLKGAVLAAADITKAPVALAAQSALSTTSLAVQAFADVSSLGGVVPLSLYAVTIAVSGERKSATDKKLMRGVREHEASEKVRYDGEFRDWLIAHAIWKAEHEKILQTLKSAKGEKTKARLDLEQLGPPPEAPMKPYLTAREPTLEGLHKLYAEGQPSLGIFSDEGGQFVGGHAMSAENRLKTVAGLSDLWGGEPINRVRAGDGSSTLHGRRLAIHVMLQPIAARPLLADPVAIGQGFLARCLVTEPESTIGTRTSRGHSMASEAEVEAYSLRLQTILAAPKPVDPDDLRHLMPRVLPLSSAASEVLWNYYLFVEQEQAIGGQLEGVKGFASKSPEQAARIAGVLTLYENLDATEVSEQMMENAILLAQYYLEEAMRLAEAAAVAHETDMAEKLKRWLQQSWPKVAAKNGRDPKTFLPGDVVQHGPNALRVTAEVMEYLKVLQDHGHIERLPAHVVVDGRKRKAAYRIVGAS